MKEIIDFEVKQSLLGKYRVHYPCPECNEWLKSPIEDAGHPDSCPECELEFIVPGMAWLKNRERERAAKREKEEKHFDRLGQQQRLADASANLESTTKKCTFCAEEIAYAAIKCKHCGEFLDGRRSEPVAHPRRDLVLFSPVGCVVLFLLFIVLVFIISLLPDGSNQTLTPPRDTRQSTKKYLAWSMAQRFVKDRLKSPSTASFGGGPFSDDYQRVDDVVTSLGGGKYRVSAWVDSQNSFGATIRTPFLCELEDRGNDKWQCTSVVLLE